MYFFVEVDLDLGLHDEIAPPQLPKVENLVHDPEIVILGLETANHQNDVLGMIMFTCCFYYIYVCYIIFKNVCLFIYIFLYLIGADQSLRKNLLVEMLQGKKGQGQSLIQDQGAPQEAVLAPHNFLNKTNKKKNRQRKESFFKLYSNPVKK